MRGFWIAGVSMALGLLCAVSAPNPARAGDEQFFAGLVPGMPLPEQALGDVHGRGVSTGSTFSENNESAGFASIDLRKLLSETLRSVGVRPPLVPSAGLETRPDLGGSTGGARSFDAMRSASASRISLPTGLGSVSLPRTPSVPSLPNLSGGTSFGGSSSGSSQSFSR